jgi:hypothetical protein
MSDGRKNRFNDPLPRLLTLEVEKRLNQLVPSIPARILYPTVMKDAETPGA